MSFVVVVVVVVVVAICRDSATVHSFPLLPSRSKSEGDRGLYT